MNQEYQRTRPQEAFGDLPLYAICNLKKKLYQTCVRALLLVFKLNNAREVKARSIYLCNPGMTPIMQYWALAEKPTYVCKNIVFSRRSRKNTVTTTIDWFIAPGQAHRVLCPIIILLNRLRGSFRLINSDTCSFIVSTTIFSTDSLPRA